MLNVKKIKVYKSWQFVFPSRKLYRLTKSMTRDDPFYLYSIFNLSLQVGSVQICGSVLMYSKNTFPPGGIQ